MDNINNTKNNNKSTPQHPGATMWLGQMRDGAWGIGDVVHACCDYLAAGVEWHSRYDNAAPLVDYARRWGVDDVMDPDARLLPHAVAQMDGIAALLTDVTDAARAQHVCALVHTDPRSVRYADIYHLLSDHWDDLRSWSMTYRLMADLALMHQWRDNADARAHLYRTIAAVSSSWQ